MTISGLTTFLWFNTQAFDAASLYVATFPGATMGSVQHLVNGDSDPTAEPTILMVSFSLFGQRFTALNGGPQFHHSPAISFQVFCDTQDEIDQLWEGLSRDGGTEGNCGWLVDPFGVSWQVIPRVLGEHLSHPDPAHVQRAHAAMMGMKKLIIADFD